MLKSDSFKSVLLGLLFLPAIAGLCFAQEPLSVEKIEGNVYMVKGGSGANTGFYVGENGVLVIDAKMTADAAKRIIQEIGKITSKPIIGIILTHSDGDHVNGLGGFPKGLKIYAHVATKKDMEEAAKAPNMQFLRDYLPNEISSPTASKESVMTIQTGGENLQLYYFGPAHTSGDIVVYFPKEKVAFVGDLVFVGRDPLIHRAKGGTSTGLQKYLESLLDLDANTFMTGHSDPLSKKDVRDAYNSIRETREKVKAMVAEGRSLQEVKKAFGIEESSSKPGGMRFMSFIEVVYLDLTENK